MGERRKLYEEEHYVLELHKKLLEWLDQRGLDTTYLDEIIITQKMLTGNSEELFGRPRCRCEDNIKADVKGIGCRDVDWAHVVQVDVTCFEHGIKLSGSIKFEAFLDQPCDYKLLKPCCSPRS